MSPEDTPLQAGLAFAVEFNKKTPFIGQDALLKQRDEGITRRLISLTLDAQDVYPMGNEPIYYEGQVIGKTTSGTYGHTLKRPVMLGYIKIQEAGLKTMLQQGTFEVEYACVRYPAKASLRGFYDPKGKRLRE